MVDKAANKIEHNARTNNLFVNVPGSAKD
ncbi:uncharacterized protein FFFS_10181 [Fusarium fujikuroi]|nr:uncharacterized protein FFFS_10181 [Fusarium fujikuroi]